MELKQPHVLARVVRPGIMRIMHAKTWFVFRHNTQQEKLVETLVFAIIILFGILSRESALLIVNL